MPPFVLLPSSSSVISSPPTYSAKAPSSKDKNPTRQRSLADFFNPRSVTSSSPAPSSSTASTPRAKQPAALEISSPVKTPKVMEQVGGPVKGKGKGKGREVLHDEDPREAREGLAMEPVLAQGRAPSSGALTPPAVLAPGEEEEDGEVPAIVCSQPAPAAMRTPSVETVEEELEAPATSATLVDLEDLDDGPLESTPRPLAVLPPEVDVPGSGSDMSMSSESPIKGRANGNSVSAPLRQQTYSNSLPEQPLDLPPSNAPSNSDMSMSSGSPLRPRAAGTPIPSTPLQKRYDPLPSPLPALRIATPDIPHSDISVASPRTFAVRASTPIPDFGRQSSPLPSSPSFHTASAGSFEALPHLSSQQIPSSQVSAAVAPSSPLTDSSDYDLPSPNSHVSPSRTPGRRPTIPFSTPANANPRSDATYARDPSGSPLSELDESPVKRAEGWRRHTFELVVVQKRRSWAQENEEMRAMDQAEDEEVEASLRSSQVPKADGDDGDDDVDASSDDGSDSDGEAAFLAGILARAAARVGAGTTLTSTSNSLFTPIADPFYLPPSPARRSGRVSLPSAKATESIPMKARIKSVDMGFADLSSGGGGGGGKYGLKAMQSERRVGKGGVGISAWEEGKRLLDDSDDSDQDKDEEELDELSNDPFAPPTGHSTPHAASLSTTHISAMRSIVEDSNSYSQEQTSPQKREALLKVRAMEDVLTEETKGRPRTVSGIRGEDERGFWGEETSAAPYVLSELQGRVGMWEAAIFLAIRAALVDPTSFPSPVTLCSRLRGHGTALSRPLVARNLLSLKQAIQLLHRLAQHTSTLSDEAPSTLLTSQDFHTALKVLGAKQESEGDGDVDMREGPPGKNMSESQRNSAVLRICRVIQALSSTTRRILSGSDTRSLIHLVISLSLSPTSSPLRSSLEMTLQSLASTIAPTDLNLTKRLIKSLVEKYYDQSARVQVEVLRVLPRGRGGKVLRKWVAWCWLLKKETGLSALSTKPITKPPPLGPLISALQNPREGYFEISDTMNDSELYSRTLVLTIALTDLGEMYVEEGGKIVMEGVKSLGRVLKEIEQRIRTNIRSGNPERNRAKNALTRLMHSLDYRVTVGAPRVGLEEALASDEEEEGEEEEEKEKEEKVVVKRRKPNRGPEARGEVALF